MALGHHLSTELGFSGSCDTAGKWMSHHLAELIDKAEHEKDPEAKSEYQNKAAELILKIWNQRTSLKGDSYPLSKYKGILNALSILSPERSIWNNHRGGKFESLAADSFSMIKDLYRGLIFSEYSGLKAYKDKQVPPSVLSEDELEIYNFLESWAEEEYDFRTIKENHKGLTEDVQAKMSICDLIDDLTQKLSQIKESIEDELDDR